ncbi:MAG: hypothetical protein AB1489_11930 [Acidobacteriota bacterium]
MSSNDRVTLAEIDLARRLEEEVWNGTIIGQAFAFLDKGAFSRLACNYLVSRIGPDWLVPLIDESAAISTLLKPQVVSLLGPQALELPGLLIRPLDLHPLSNLAPFRLASITSDKMLYREGRDQIHLLVLDPLLPGEEVVLEVHTNRAEFARYPISLNAQGVATVTLRDLPIGEYEVRFRGAPNDESVCKFTVAEYRLAPLVVSLVERQMQNAPSSLLVKLRIESFGTPVNGKVELELVENGRRVSRLTTEAVDGIADASFPLSGEGPYTINVQLSADPARTATVPIVGSRATERSATIFSSLGAEVSGSLLPSVDSHPVRGIFLTEGAQCTTPFQLERVDTRKARLTATSTAEAVRVIVISTNFPIARPNAIDANTAPHPANQDERYQQAEALFKEGRFAEARAIFIHQHATLSSPHPFYAYYIACCYALEGDRERAVDALYIAIKDGWNDFAHLAKDADLASLHGYQPYETLKTAGRREFVLGAVTVGDWFEFEISEPMALLAIGAWVSGKPWEGWAAVVTPERLIPTINVPERVVPGSEIEIEVDTDCQEDASVYLIIKDARLLTSDTPTSRLAGQMKSFVAAAAQQLTTDRPQNRLSDTFNRSLLQTHDVASNAMCISCGRMNTPGSSFCASCGTPLPIDQILMMGTALPPVPFMASMVEFGLPASASPYALYEAGDTLAAASIPTGSMRPVLTNQDHAARTDMTEDPEVVFAGLLEASAGRAKTTVRLGNEFADYLIEAFVIQGLDWASTQARFRAQKETFISLDIPTFVHSKDVAIGRVHVGSSGRMRLRVTRDSEDIPLSYQGRTLTLGEELVATRAEVIFLTEVGEYQAIVEDLENGVTERVTKRVEAPGRLRRMVRTMRLLEPGDHISADADKTIFSLHVLPSLDKPFKVLVDATANYEHACCEQTGAKILSACAMYIFADKDSEQRSRAEAIIIAGVRREATMWLRGRGFKMYPESPDEPSSYYTPKVARYLYNLALLRDVDGNKGLSRALEEAIAAGLRMANDTAHTCGLRWPPVETNTCEEAYFALRFNNSTSAQTRALALVRARVNGERQPVHPYLCGAVGLRVEAAYAAASLLRAGGSQNRVRAIELTNRVLKDFGDQGRLYSTVDSVAAIALMIELQAAGIVGGGGLLEINGVRLSATEALNYAGEIHSVMAMEGVAAIEVMRIIEEDWSSFASNVQLRIALEKNGQAIRRFTVGDAIDLKVTLKDGYQNGDLVWICLPAALSRIVGGGQVKRFAIDFAGSNEVIVPLAATSLTPNREGSIGHQWFAICVRNMFEEERAGNPGLIEVMVTPADTY